MQSSVSLIHGRRHYCSSLPHSTIPKIPLTPKLNPIPKPFSTKTSISLSSPLLPRSPAPLLCGNSSNTLPAPENKSFRDWVVTTGEALSTAFPVWVALGCLLGLLRPSSFNWVQPKWTIMGISVTMLGMGMTLTFDDLRSAFAMPKELLAGFVLQYSIMPLSAYFVSKLLKLPSYYAAGLILVGCCPGGTASNIVTYIANGNVALSVLMTAASTVASVIMTPFLTAKLAGQYVAVDAIGLLKSTLQDRASLHYDLWVTNSSVGNNLSGNRGKVGYINPPHNAGAFITGLPIYLYYIFTPITQVVLLPVLAGAFLNQYFQGLVKFVSPLMPSIAVGVVAVLCGDAIAQSSAAILKSGQQVVLAAALLHASGFFFGYIFSRALGIDISSSRTISIEVGMQNSVLGVVLASQHFGNPLTAAPCAVSSVCHSIFGSTLAGIWRRSTPKQLQDSNVDS